MKTATPELIAFLNSSQEFNLADLFTFTLSSGLVLRYTGADVDITAGGNTYSSGGLRFVRDRTRTVIGVEVDTMNIEIYAGQADLISSVPFLQACRNGAFDSATLRLDRAVMSTFGDTSKGAVLQFVGRVADIQAGRTTAKMTIKSDLELLNVQMPRNLYQAGCMNTLFDASCGLSKSANGVAGTVTSGTLTQINCGLTQGVGHFTQGTITFSSGVNSNVTRAVKSYSPGIITLSQPLLAVCSIGDAFTIYAGCDKKQATCSAKFNNLLRYRGFPYIPAPETAI